MPLVCFFVGSLILANKFGAIDDLMENIQRVIADVRLQVRQIVFENRTSQQMRRLLANFYLDNRAKFLEISLNVYFCNNLAVKPVFLYL